MGCRKLTYHSKNSGLKLVHSKNGVTSINTFEKAHIALEYRIHDAEIGRFLSRDPLAADYAHNSPYAFSENRVIDGRELEGLEWAPYSFQSVWESIKPGQQLSTDGGTESEAWGSMTIHSSAGPNAGIVAGHAWIEFESADGTTTKTLSLWGNTGGEEFVANKEIAKKTPSAVSRTVSITKQDIKIINKFNSVPENIDWTATNTCAGYCTNLWNEVTGEELNSTNTLGLTTPSVLTNSIINQNGGQLNTNGKATDNRQSATVSSANSSASNSSSNSSSAGSGSSTSSNSSSGSSGGGSSLIESITGQGTGTKKEKTTLK
jgi:hypothetical protein